MQGTCFISASKRSLTGAFNLENKSQIPRPIIHKTIKTLLTHSSNIMERYSLEFCKCFTDETNTGLLHFHWDSSYWLTARHFIHHFMKMHFQGMVANRPLKLVTLKLIRAT